MEANLDKHPRITLEGPHGKSDVPYPGSFPEWAYSIANQVLLVRGLPGAAAFSESDFGLLDDALERIQGAFLLAPYAFAPIRTSPKRTYDPISAGPNSEGSHVPTLLAALSRSGHGRRWTELQSVLQEFGAKSGLFEGIEVVEKGTTDSDPFQIGVKSGGRTFNLIDVPGRSNPYGGSAQTA